MLFILSYLKEQTKCFMLNDNFRAKRQPQTGVFIYIHTQTDLVLHINIYTYICSYIYVDI